MKTSMLGFDTEVTLLGVYQLWIRTQLGHFETTENEFHHEPRNELLVDLKEVLEEHRQKNGRRGGKKLDQDYKELWDMKTEVTRA